MRKTILYRLFGVGSVPRQLRAELQSEGILLLDEGLAALVTYLDFRARHSDKQDRTIVAAFTRLARRVTRPAVLRLGLSAKRIFQPVSTGLPDEALAVVRKAT